LSQVHNFFFIIVADSYNVGNCWNFVSVSCVCWLVLFFFTFIVIPYILLDLFESRFRGGMLADFGARFVSAEWVVLFFGFIFFVVVFLHLFLFLRLVVFWSTLILYLSGIKYALIWLVVGWDILEVSKFFQFIVFLFVLIFLVALLKLQNFIVFFLLLPPAHLIFLQLALSFF